MSEIYRRVGVPYSNRLPQQLNWSENSGRIVYRRKIGTVVGVNHPGIILGLDNYGYEWVAHHHYKNVYPSIDRLDAFALGQGVFYDERPVWYDRKIIVERALRHWLEQKEYNWLRQNCQHFVNNVASDTHESEAIDQVANLGLTISGVAGILGIVTGNKTLTNIALTTAVVSVGTKVVSRSNNRRALSGGGRRMIR